MKKNLYFLYLILAFGSLCSFNNALAYYNDEEPPSEYVNRPVDLNEREYNDCRSAYKNGNSDYYNSNCADRTFNSNYRKY